MSTTYNVVGGDTFELIARKQYGTEQGAGAIASANPGVLQPLLPGTTVIGPDWRIFGLRDTQQTVLQPPPVVLADNPDEVAILIGGVRFRFWSAVRITRATDNLDTIEFSAPFDPDLPNFREMFRPFSYQTLDITVGGEQLFTGTLVGVDPTVGVDSIIVDVSGYSRPGVLADCTAPASAYPIEFNDLTLPEIAHKLLEPFGLGTEFFDVGSPFDRVALAPGSAILPFLAGLAKQRTLVMSSTTDGALLFWRSLPAGAPVASLRQGSAPVISIDPFFAPQNYFSHMTGLEQVTVGEYGSQFTARNPRLSGVIRPTSFMIRDTAPGDIEAVVNAAAGRMSGNAVGYTVEVATWRDPQGALWEPNTNVQLLAPGVMVYEPYTFEIRGVSFNATDKSRTATLDLVIPGSFGGILPESMPWDG